MQKSRDWSVRTMIKLPNISNDIKNSFLKYIKPRFKNLLLQFRNTSTYPLITNYFFNGTNLDDNKVTGVLTGDISSLINAIDSIGSITGSTNTSPQQEFIKLYQNFTSSKLGKSLCDDLGIKVCPYCNRSYIHTLKYHRVRPQYDHFFSKIKYPYLAVSLYNLIPSCSICNQAKSDIDTYDPVRKSNSFLYPYENEYGYDVCFKTEFNGDISYILGKNENFELNIDNYSSNTDFQQIVQKTIDTLHTKELYAKHKDYVLDVIRVSQIYNEEYLLDILQKFPNLFNDIPDVKRMVYMNYLDKEHWGDRVLSKLTFDISQEFKIN